MKRIPLLLVVLLAGCQGTPGPEKPEDPTLDVCEAVFRHQFEHNASAAQQKAEAYFLSLLGKDPSPAFLSRFEGHVPPVQRGSGFAIGKGLLFRIESVERVDENTYRVRGGYYEAQLSSSGNVYTVKRRNGKWAVTDDSMEWIS